MFANVVTLCVGSANAKENCLIQEMITIMVEGKMFDYFKSESPPNWQPIKIILRTPK